MIGGGKEEAIKARFCLLAGQHVAMSPHQPIVVLTGADKAGNAPRLDLFTDVLGRIDPTGYSSSVVAGRCAKSPTWISKHSNVHPAGG